MRKSLSYFKNLAYSLIIEKIQDEDGLQYYCYTEELGKYSCYGIGETEVEAINHFKEVKEGFIEYLYGKELPIPEPRTKVNLESFSGKFTVRTSPQVHSILVKQADEQGLSLNAYVNQSLTSACYMDEIKGYLDGRLRVGEIFMRKHHDEICYHLTQFSFGKAPKVDSLENYVRFLNKDKFIPTT
ncbi:MAG: toxin-antitoxin system HicB family antitoxin [Bacteroidales bacterium]|nr:toxin-antitoxin system HicB family antitoxin [Bacteroidales bacterium]